MIAKATSKIEIIPCASKTRESSNLGTVPNVNNPQNQYLKAIKYRNKTDEKDKKYRPFNGSFIIKLSQTRYYR